MKLLVSSHGSCSSEGCSRCLLAYQPGQKPNHHDSSGSLPAEQLQRRLTISLSWKDYGTRNKLRQAVSKIRPVKSLSLTRLHRERTADENSFVEPPNLEGLFELESPIAELPGGDLLPELSGDSPTTTEPMTAPAYHTIVSETSSSVFRPSMDQYNMRPTKRYSFFEQPDDLMLMRTEIEQGYDSYSSISPPQSANPFVDRYWHTTEPAPFSNPAELQGNDMWTDTVSPLFSNTPPLSPYAHPSFSPELPQAQAIHEPCRSVAGNVVPQAQEQIQSTAEVGTAFLTGEPMIEKLMDQSKSPLGLGLDAQTFSQNLTASEIMLQRLREAMMSRPSSLLAQLGADPFPLPTEHYQLATNFRELAESLKGFLGGTNGDYDDISKTLCRLAYPIMASLVGDNFIQYARGYQHILNVFCNIGGHSPATGTFEENCIGYPSQSRLVRIVRSSSILSASPEALTKDGLYIVLCFIATLGSVLELEQPMHIDSDQLMAAHPHCVPLTQDMVNNLIFPLQAGDFMPYHAAVQRSMALVMSGQLRTLVDLEQTILKNATEEFNKLHHKFGDAASLFNRFVATLIERCDAAVQTTSSDYVLGNKGLQDCFRGLDTLGYWIEVLGSNYWPASDHFPFGTPIGPPPYTQTAMEPSLSQSTSTSGVTWTDSLSAGSSLVSLTSSNSPSAPEQANSTQFWVTRCPLCGETCVTDQANGNRTLPESIIKHFEDCHGADLDHREIKLARIRAKDSDELKETLKERRHREGHCLTLNIKWQSFCPSCLSPFESVKGDLKDARDRVRRHLQTTQKCAGGHKLFKWMCSQCRRKRFTRIDSWQKHESKCRGRQIDQARRSGRLAGPRTSTLALLAPLAPLGPFHDVMWFLLSILMATTCKADGRLVSFVHTSYTLAYISCCKDSLYILRVRS